MRDFLAGASLLACIIVFGASLIALVRPMRAIWMPTRKRALAGIGVGFALFVFTAILMPPPKEEHAAHPAPVVPPKPEAVELTKDQDALVLSIRNIVMQTIGCSGGMNMTQREIDKLAAENSRPIDVYQEAKRGIKSCDDAVAEFDRPDVFDDVNVSIRKDAKDALKPCIKAAGGRKSAMALAQELLEYDGGLASVSRYLELRDSAANDEALCRLGLISVATKAGVPAKEVEFAEP